MGIVTNRNDGNGGFLFLGKSKGTSLGDLAQLYHLVMIWCDQVRKDSNGRTDMESIDGNDCWWNF